MSYIHETASIEACQISETAKVYRFANLKHTKMGNMLLLLISAKWRIVLWENVLACMLIVLCIILL